MFTMGDKQNPVDIAKASIEHAKENDNNIVILDTAGRLHVDESMIDVYKRQVLVLLALAGIGYLAVTKLGRELMGLFSGAPEYYVYVQRTIKSVSYTHLPR